MRTRISIYTLWVGLDAKKETCLSYHHILTVGRSLVLTGYTEIRSRMSHRYGNHACSTSKNSIDEVRNPSALINTFDKSFQESARNLKTVRLPQVLIMPFLDFGLLASVTNLTLGCEHYGSLHEMFISLHAISYLPRLQKLHIKLDYTGNLVQSLRSLESRSQENYLRIKSDSLRSLILDIREGDIITTCLTLFRECAIEAIGARIDCQMEDFAKILDSHFPHLRKLDVLQGSPVRQ